MPLSHTFHSRAEALASLGCFTSFLELRGIFGNSSLEFRAWVLAAVCFDTFLGKTSRTALMNAHFHLGHFLLSFFGEWSNHFSSVPEILLSLEALFLSSSELPPARRGEPSG